MTSRSAFALATAAWLWFAAALPALALGPLETLVVVNRNDAASRDLGEAYLQKHGIPASHRCEVALPTRTQEITPETFERDVRVPIDAHLDRHGLRNQIQVVVFCWAGPTRVGGNGLPAVWYYGHKPPKPGAPKCHVADDSRNRYFMAERPYRSSAGWSPFKAPLAFVLTARTAEDALAAIDGAASAEGLRPDSSLFVLASSGDSARNVRARFHPGVAAQFAREGWSGRLETPASAPALPERPPAVCSLGQANFPAAWATNGFRMAPGSIGENLTSCGGQLPKPCLGQHGVWDWLSAGASASYGTVTEPCNFTSKFPHPVYAYYCARGWSAAEALWMAVENPYQGLFAGDPLAAPFAANPRVEILSPRPGETVSGTVSLRLKASADPSPDAAPPVWLDLYIDGRHYTPMARPLAPAGNLVEVRVGERLFRYTVQRDDDLYGVAEGLAWTIRSAAKGTVRTRAHGDSVTLSIHSDDPVAVSAEVSAGLAAAPRMGIRVCAPDGLSVPEGAGLQGAELRLEMGAARSFPLSYPIDLSFLDPGPHTLTVVARDGSAVQAQGQASVSIVVAPAP